MTEINISSRMFANYLESLVDRTFKILPLHEEDNEGLFKYIQSLSHELRGLQGVISRLDVDSDYIILLATFETLSEEILLYGEMDSIKREIFKCISIIKRIRDKATLESGDE